MSFFIYNFYWKSSYADLVRIVEKTVAQKTRDLQRFSVGIRVIFGLQKFRKNERQLIEIWLPYFNLDRWKRRLRQAGNRIWQDAGRRVVRMDQKLLEAAKQLNGDEGLSFSHALKGLAATWGRRPAPPNMKSCYSSFLSNRHGSSRATKGIVPTSYPVILLIIYRFANFASGNQIAFCVWPNQGVYFETTWSTQRSHSQSGE